MGMTDSPTSNGSPTSRPVHLSADQSSIVEPRTILGAAPVDDMFLSPRVIDGSAFSKYSDMLKAIISQANAQGRTLEDFSTDADAMIKRCDVTSEAINKRMQSGVRMLKMIDERAARTDLLLDKVQAAQPDSEALANKIDKLIEQRLAETEQRVGQIVQHAQERVEAAEERARLAIERSDGHAVKLAELSSRIDGQLGELDARIENTRRETSNTLVEILDRTNKVTQELNGTLDGVIARSHEAGANLAAKIDEASMMTDARIAELNKVLEPMVDASQQAMRTLGMDPENPVFADSPLARIEQLVERGETQTASLDRVYRQLEDLQSQAEGVKAVFGVWLVDAAGELDVLEARKDTLVGPISQAADKVAKLGPDVEDNLELASTKLTHLMIEQKALRQTIEASSAVASDVSNRMTNESGQLQALLDGSLHKLSTRVEQAGVWLGALIQRAESLGGSLPGAGRMEFGTEPIDEPIAKAAVETQPVSTPAPAPIIHQPVPNPIGESVRDSLAEPAAESTPKPMSLSEPLRAMTDIAELVDNDDVMMQAVERAIADAEEQVQAADQSFVERLVEPTVEPTVEPVIEPVNDRAMVSPQPPCLPIDAMSFDGALNVIEHKDK